MTVKRSKRRTLRTKRSKRSKRKTLRTKRSKRRTKRSKRRTKRKGQGKSRKSRKTIKQRGGEGDYVKWTANGRPGQSFYKVIGDVDDFFAPGPQRVDSAGNNIKEGPTETEAKAATKRGELQEVRLAQQLTPGQREKNADHPRLFRRGGKEFDFYMAQAYRNRTEENTAKDEKRRLRHDAKKAAKKAAAEAPWYSSDAAPGAFAKAVTSKASGAADGLARGLNPLVKAVVYDLPSSGVSLAADGLGPAIDAAGRPPSIGEGLSYGLSSLYSGARGLYTGARSLYSGSPDLEDHVSLADAAEAKAEAEAVEKYMKNQQLDAGELDVRREERRLAAKTLGKTVGDIRRRKVAAEDEESEEDEEAWEALSDASEPEDRNDPDNRGPLNEWTLDELAAYEEADELGQHRGAEYGRQYRDLMSLGDGSAADVERRAIAGLRLLGAQGRR